MKYHHQKTWNEQRLSNNVDCELKRTWTDRRLRRKRRSPSRRFSDPRLNSLTQWTNHALNSNWRRRGQSDSTVSIDVSVVVVSLEPCQLRVRTLSSAFIGVTTGESSLSIDWLAAIRKLVTPALVLVVRFVAFVVSLTGIHPPRQQYRRHMGRIT